MKAQTIVNGNPNLVMEQLLKEVKKFNIFEAGEEEYLKKTVKVAEGAKVEFYYNGKVKSITTYPNADSYVSVQFENGSYSSPWPEWAAEIAKDAFLNDKKICVFAEGMPMGDNLLMVKMYD